MISSKLLEGIDALLYHFTDRLGGCGTAPFNTLNLAYHAGDVAATVERNHQILASILGYDRHRLVHMRQIHSDRIVRCADTMAFDSRPECDALITDHVGQPIMVMTADCTPLLLYDPLRHAAAAIHAGRAGALKNIVGKSVSRMVSAFSTDPADLLAVLGPSIHSCCYEIGQEVAEEVRAAGYCDALERRDDSYFLDVNPILQTQLLAAGLKPRNIEILGYCTACRNDRFFSYRADGGTTGRQAAIIMLK